MDIPASCLHIFCQLDHWPFLLSPPAIPVESTFRKLLTRTPDLFGDIQGRLVRQFDHPSKDLILDIPEPEVEGFSRGQSPSEIIAWLDFFLLSANLHS
jgi:hypothetical protein